MVMKGSIKDSLPFVLQHFRFSYIGIFAPHVLIYCIVHHDTMSHEGILPGIPLYLALSICMIGAMLVAWRAKKITWHSWIDWLVATITSLALVPMIFPLIEASAILTITTTSLAGIGIAYLYLRWTTFFASLPIKDAIACIFGAMAIGSLCKLFLAFMPSPLTLLCLVVLAPLSILLSRDAEKFQPPCDNVPVIHYEEDMRSVPWKILFGVAVYSFILGALQGSFTNPPIVATEILILSHHLAEVLIAGLIIWWVFARKGFLRFSGLWRAIFLFTATGLFLLPIFGQEWVDWSIVLISIAQTLVVMLFWTMLADVSKHSSVSPIIIFGSGWTAYTLPLALGEIVGQYTSLSDSSTYFVAILGYVLTIAAVFALNERDLSQRRIFSDLEITAPEKSLYGNIDKGCTAVGKEYGLSDREVEVLQLLCKGRSKSYIAENLFISENTVRSHTKNIYQKLDIHSKQEALDIVLEVSGVSL